MREAKKKLAVYGEFEEDTMTVKFPGAQLTVKVNVVFHWYIVEFSNSAGKLIYKPASGVSFVSNLTPLSSVKEANDLEELGKVAQLFLS